MTPTARSLKELRDNGYIAQVVERWNSFARIRIDLFGIIDIIALHPEKQGVLGIQATSTPNVSARLEKARQNPNLSVWMRCGNGFQVWGWAKRGARGERKLWTLSRRTLGEEQHHEGAD